MPYIFLDWRIKTLFFFQNIPHSDLYTSACVWTNCRSTFATLIEKSPKRAFWTHQSILQVSKNVGLSFYFLRMEIKRSYSVPSQDYTIFWVLKNAIVWADVWELALSWWRLIRLRRLVFLISWKITGKQMVVYHSELTTSPVSPKKQAIICLEVLRARAIFVGFDLSWNTHTVDCCLLLGSYVQIYDSSPITMSWTSSKHHDRIFGAFLSTNQHEQNFLTVNCSCNIECMLVLLMPMVVSISR